MQKRRIFINAIMSIVQVILVSAILFVLYRFLLKTIGVEQLGIWSLVLATTSVIQISNLGLSGSVIKYVAKYVARSEDREVAAVIQTAIISLAVVVGFVLLVGYPIIKWVLSVIMSLDSLEKAIQILPFALLSLWLMAITGIIQSGLDGLQRIYVRNFIIIGGSVFYTFLCFILTPKRGLIGLAYAQLINTSVILFLSWLLIKKYLPQIPIIPYKWNKTIFKEIIGYGVNFQITTALTLFYDPITKALLSKFSGLSMVGYYEMATKLVQQIQSIIMSANQVMVPAIAALKENANAKIRPIFLKSYELIQYISLPIFSLLIIGMPLISQIWIGHYERIFIISAILLSIGRFINTLRSPAYFTYLGIGVLRWNAISHITIFVLNCTLGFFFAKLFGGYGIVVALVIAIIIGSSINLISYYIKENISLNQLLPKSNRRLMLVCLSTIMFTYLFQHNLSHFLGIYTSSILFVLLGALLILIPFLTHSMRKNLKFFIFSGLSRKYIEEIN